MDSGFNRQSIGLFDHLIDERQQFIQHLEAERFRGLEVDDQLELILVGCSIGMSRAFAPRRILST